MTIADASERRKKYDDERFRFVGLKDFGFKRLLDFMEEQEVNKIKKQLDKYKKQSSKIEFEGDTPLLKLNKGEDWNFLYENYDFEVSLTGKINLFV